MRGSFPGRAAIFFIRIYQKTLSPDHGITRGFYPGGYCRFYPSCSTYGREAIGRYGLRHGGRLALWRLCRCHPWSPGGYDPVP
ncbi:MAG TPA: membrane protein insertion efficiency factor YidD [Patescibacteria group bacterium]|nr:membrane protein insertion efficiency factor YidD [Patescibacteria group bacterium]